MGRMYVASTPATRGEVEEGETVTESGLPADLTEEETVALLEEAAFRLGYQLVPIESEEDDDDSGEPAGNASTEVWVEFAKSKGATEDDLKDEKGEPLGRDALREKFGTPAQSGD